MGLEETKCPASLCVMDPGFFVRFVDRKGLNPRGVCRHVCSAAQERSNYMRQATDRTG